MLQKSRVKDIQSLAHKKSRDELGIYAVEGPKMVAELLTWDRQSLQALYATETWVSEQGSAPEASLLNLLTVVTETELSAISFQQTPNRVLAIARKPQHDSMPSLKGKITLLLDTIQDPGNLGTILRTADWFGVEQVVCSPETADVFNPKVVQATMGAVFRVAVYYLDPIRFTKDLQDVPLVCSALEGEDLFTCHPLREAVIVIGNESRGASQTLMDRATRRVTIPRYGHSESLNAAVATGIILSRLVAG
jgi:RNA methyltransferase, TrmH family